MPIDELAKKIDFKNTINKHALVDKHRNCYAKTNKYTFVLRTYKKHFMEFYAAERKKELIPLATAWVELESIMLSEISQAVKDKYHMISPLTGT